MGGAAPHYHISNIISPIRTQKYRICFCSAFFFFFYYYSFALHSPFFTLWSSGWICLLCSFWLGKVGKWCSIMVHKHYLTLTQNRDYSRQNRLVNLMTRTIRSLCLFRHREKNVPIFLKSEGDVMKWGKAWKEHTWLVNIWGSNQKSSLLSFSISLTCCGAVTLLPLLMSFGVWINSKAIYVSFDLICHKSTKAPTSVELQFCKKVVP